MMPIAFSCVLRPLGKIFAVASLGGSLFYALPAAADVPTRATPAAAPLQAPRPLPKQAQPALRIQPLFPSLQASVSTDTKQSKAEKQHKNIAPAQVLRQPILTPAQIQAYQHIFALIRKGECQKAKKQLAKMPAGVLHGDALAAIYLHPWGYKSKYAELKAWLQHYAAWPEAQRIYALALRKGRAAGLRRPVRSSYLQGQGGHGEKYMPWLPSGQRYTGATRATVQKMVRFYRKHIGNGKTKNARLVLDKLLQTVHLHARDHDLMAGVQAHAYYIDGEDALALAWAEPAAKRSGGYAVMANWAAGLAHWRAGAYARALPYFKTIATSKYSSSWMASAGGYWAYRAAIQLRKPDDAIGYLKIARQYRHTFYGILAARALGEDMPFQWQHLAYDNPQGYAETVQKLPTWARHVKALLEVGETDRAEDALRANYPYKTPNESLLAQSLASIGNMAGLAMRMAALSRDMALDDAYYPRPEWSPLDAWRLTSDLVFAFARQESGFNPKARSYVGARGVMQLMPATARFVRKKLPDQLAKGSLFDPNYNVTLGQKYIEMLMDDPIVGENLFYLPIAYNAGPGNLQKWQQRVPHHDDPLLFIESMPSRETRHFLKRVITNYWAYKDQAGLPTPTVDQVLQGKWPHYVIPNKPPANNVQNQPADQPQSKAELHAVSIE